MEAPVEVPEVLQLTTEERFELRQLDRQVRPTRTEEKQIELSPEQEKVVNMALRKNNIFLTGAAGCGKTVTLKEISRRLQKKKRGGNVQVVAPTGIAALPLDGKTTYSFAGVSRTFFLF
jgi:Cdc6-like AAA superfamily ATPase